MQVSWIDPEEVAALAESLRPPARPQPPAKAPEPAPRQEPVQPLVADTPATEADASSPATDTGGMPNLAAFRQRLQSIRERAISAGLMTPKPPAPPEPPPAPAPAAEAVTSPPAEPDQQPEQEPASELAPSAESPAFEEAAPSLPEPEPESPSQEPAPQWQPQPESFTSPSPPPVQYNVPVAPPPVEMARLAPQPHIEISPGASVKDRLDAFASWAGQQWGPSELLIVDEYGDLLWGPPKKAGLVLSTMMAWNAAIRASAQAANGMAQIQQQVLATGETLTIIPCKTRLGMLQIALVKAQAPWGEETSVLREALVQVMDIPG
ncbi:hypothetical protein WJU23_13880 [Prosthecobacter sp. SYSU 5D2]|uniref:hypothetical protein n=1 Tax=Prosthecobacter sp. SYSU 5D2 TaxID=3134134 RepID=UPI0031FEFB40